MTKRRRLFGKGDSKLPRLLCYLTTIELIVLVGAGAGLFFLPGPAGRAWPWDLTPFTTRFLGAVYLAALVAVALLLLIGRWSPARVTLWAIFGFTALVFVISLIEIDRFDLGQPAAWGWFALYFILPVNAAYHLWRYRAEPLPEPVPNGPIWQALLGGAAVLFGFYSLGLLALPDTFTGFWPWPVDDFHARIYSAAFLSVVIGLLAIWRAARPIEMLSVGCTHATLGLLAIAGLLVVDDRRDSVSWSAGGVWLWVLGFAGLAALSLGMLYKARAAFGELPIPRPGPERGFVIGRWFALVLSAAFIAAGVSGFLPLVTTDPPADAHQIDLTLAYRQLVGLYLVNLLHNLTHLAFGFAGLAAYADYISIRSYARAMALILTVLTVMGLIPGLQTVFGLMPLFGHDVWLQAIEAAAAAYVGYAISTDPVPAGVGSRAAVRG